MKKKQRIRELEKRVAELEKKIEAQPEVTIKAIADGLEKCTENLQLVSISKYSY